MFDKLFRSRVVVQRHLSSPLLQERLEYLQHCANRSSSRKCQVRRLVMLEGETSLVFAIASSENAM